MTVTGFSDVIIEKLGVQNADELEWKVAFNAPIRQDSFAENISV